MKADRARTGLAFKGRRQCVLTGMLLHVIEAAFPVDAASNARVFLELAIDEMRDGAVFSIDDVEHGRVTQGSSVERLAARGGIERGTIERDLPPIALPHHVA